MSLTHRSRGVETVLQSTGPPTTTTIARCHAQVRRYRTFRAHPTTEPVPRISASASVLLPAVTAAAQDGFVLDLLDHDAFVQQLGKVLFDPATLQARAAYVPAELAGDVAALPTAPQRRRCW